MVARERVFRQRVVDNPLNEAPADQIRDYRADYNNRPSNREQDVGRE